MKKTFLYIVISLFLCLVFVAFLGWVWWVNQLKAPSNDPQLRSVTIAKGSNATDIASKLFEAKVIKNKFVFRLYTKLNGVSSNLPVGEFELPGNLSVPEVISFLRKGPQLFWVTIPEGLRREQIPARITSAVSFSETKAKAFEASFLELTKDDEGYLFPETYLIPMDIAPEKAVSLFKNTFNKRFPNATKDIVVMASLIERETRNDYEKPVISGILANRIRIGMPLQVDATVQYAKANLTCGSDCTDWWMTVYLDDYKIKSSFNTYVINGLPPSPISNPGLTSLKAAASPQENDYLYYIHDKTGLAHYAKTYEEHLANVQKYLR